MVIMNYERISKNFIRLVKRFDWNKIGKKHEKIYIALSEEKRKGQLVVRGELI